MAEWSDLTSELDCWRQAGQTATFWWRDDDAGPDDDHLGPFLEQRERLGVPLALATVPAWLSKPTVRRILADSGTTVVQHGWAHRNNAPENVRKMELADGTANLADDLAKGFDILSSALGERFHAVMVPPWNRLGAQTTACLADLGFVGLSTLGPRQVANEGKLHVVNVHIDIMDWTTRSFGDEGKALDTAIAHLVARREGEADRGEPTGLMTHHRDHDEPAARFVDRFVTVIRDHDAGCWLDAQSLFGTRRATA